jgi:hypothetical protein
MKHTTTQRQRILALLKRGKSITPLDAIRQFQCLRLGARIFDLRQQGFAIESETVHDRKSGKTFASYKLAA